MLVNPFNIVDLAAPAVSQPQVIAAAAVLEADNQPEQGGVPVIQNQVEQGKYIK
jgi:hypothetical protein